MKKIHFVGIGGIGVSALARLYLANGWSVSGSDIADSSLIQDMIKDGIDISIGTQADFVPDDVKSVVYSVAVKEDNPEIKKAKELGVPTLTYAQGLGEITKEYFTIAITGSHGKSTTASMAALMMIEAGLDPTVIVGTKLAEFNGTNFRKGESKYLVIEADDFNRSFWNYTPQVTAVLNVDAEHLDIYKNIEGVIEGFHTYLKNLPKESKAILNAQDPYTHKIEENLECEISYFNNKGDVLDWPLQVPGDFNQQNAQAAFQAVHTVGVTREDAENALTKFKGAWRRLEPLEPKEDVYKDTIFFSDYAHHPTEIKATVEALKERYPEKSLTIIFQPHQMSRLTELFDDFVRAFDSADNVLLLPVYKVAGRDIDNGKTADDLARSINKDSVIAVKDLDEGLAKIKDGVVVFMGAGSMDSQAREYFRSKLLPM